MRKRIAALGTLGVAPAALLALRFPREARPAAPSAPEGPGPFSATMEGDLDLDLAKAIQRLEEDDLWPLPGDPARIEREIEEKPQVLPNRRIFLFGDVESVVVLVIRRDSD